MWALLRRAASEWSDHDAPRLGAALAYYSVLSLAPLLILLVAVCGLFFGDAATRDHLYWQARTVMGLQSAEIIRAILEDAHRPAAGILTTTLGMLTLLIGASGVFTELRDSLNFIWDVQRSPTSGFRALVRSRLFSMAVVCGLGILLMASLALSALGQALDAFPRLHPSLSGAALRNLNLGISFVAAVLIFGAIYRFVPDACIPWSNVFAGSLLTAVLFSAGKVGLGLYLGGAGIGSSYGAAGSLVALLVWVYYSAQIFLYGAEVTHVYSDWSAHRRKRAPTP